MSLIKEINNFINTYQDQRKFNLDIYRQNMIKEIDIIGNIYKGEVVSLFNHNEINFFSTSDQCQCYKLDFEACQNTSSFKTNDRINLCWKHSYLYTQILS